MYFMNTPIDEWALSTAAAQGNCNADDLHTLATLAPTRAYRHGETPPSEHKGERLRAIKDDDGEGSAWALQACPHCTHAPAMPAGGVPTGARTSDFSAGTGGQHNPAGCQLRKVKIWESPNSAIRASMHLAALA